MKNLITTLVLSLGMVCGQLLTAQVDSSYFDSMKEQVSAAELELTKLDENFFIISSDAGGNILVFVGSDGLSLVDTQWEALGTGITEMLASISDKPVTRVINTHYHFDHVDGNIFFGKDGVQIIAHHKVLKRLSADQVISPPFHMLQPAYPRGALPTVTFGDNMNLYDGEEVIELIHFPDAHTDGDVVVHFKNKDLYHTGDIFVTYGLPYVDEYNGGDIYVLLEVIEHLISAAGPQTRFLPGHGPLCTVDDLSEYRDLLVSVINQARACIKEGLDVDDASSRIKVDTGKEGIGIEATAQHIYRMAQKHK